MTQEDQDRRTGSSVRRWMASSPFTLGGMTVLAGIAVGVATGSNSGDGPSEPARADGVRTVADATPLTLDGTPLRGSGKGTENKPTEKKPTEKKPTETKPTGTTRTSQRNPVDLYGGAGSREAESKAQRDEDFQTAGHDDKPKVQPKPKPKPRPRQTPTTQRNPVDLYGGAGSREAESKAQRDEDFQTAGHDNEPKVQPKPKVQPQPKPKAKAKPKRNPVDLYGGRGSLSAERKAWSDEAKQSSGAVVAVPSSVDPLAHKPADVPQDLYDLYYWGEVTPQDQKHAEQSGDRARSEAKVGLEALNQRPGRSRPAAGCSGDACTSAVATPDHVVHTDTKVGRPTHVSVGGATADTDRTPGSRGPKVRTRTHDSYCVASGKGSLCSPRRIAPDTSHTLRPTDDERPLTDEYNPDWLPDEARDELSRNAHPNLDGPHNDRAPGNASVPDPESTRTITAIDVRCKAGSRNCTATSHGGGVVHFRRDTVDTPPVMGWNDQLAEGNYATGTTGRSVRQSAEGAAGGLVDGAVALGAPEALPLAIGAVQVVDHTNSTMDAWRAKDIRARNVELAEQNVDRPQSPQDRKRAEAVLDQARTDYAKAEEAWAKELSYGSAAPVAPQTGQGRVGVTPK